MIERGTIGHLRNDKKLIIVLRIENEFLICHRFRHDNKVIRVNKSDFIPFEF